MAKNGDEELLTEKDLAELQAKKERLQTELAQCGQRIVDLRQQEDPAQGKAFAQEIFHAQQEKLRLQIEIEFCRRRVNRDRLAKEWEAEA